MVLCRVTLRMKLYRIVSYLSHLLSVGIRRNSIKREGRVPQPVGSDPRLGPALVAPPQRAEIAVRADKPLDARSTRSRLVQAQNVWRHGRLAVREREANVVEREGRPADVPVGRSRGAEGRAVWCRKLRMSATSQNCGRGTRS